MKEWEGGGEREREDEEGEGREEGGGRVPSRRVEIPSVLLEKINPRDREASLLIKFGYEHKLSITLSNPLPTQELSISIPSDSSSFFDSTAEGWIPLQASSSDSVSGSNSWSDTKWS